MSPFGLLRFWWIVPLAMVALWTMPRPTLFGPGPTLGDWAGRTILIGIIVFLVTRRRWIFDRLSVVRDAVEKNREANGNTAGPTEPRQPDEPIFTKPVSDFFGSVGSMVGPVVKDIVLDGAGKNLKKTGVHGTARFANKSDIERGGLLTDTGVLVGSFEGELLRNAQPGPIVTIAPTRAGKGRSAVIPNLLDYPGAAFVLDLKGELAAITSRYRRDVMGQAVAAFDPFGHLDKLGVDLEAARLNVMEILDPSMPDALDNARLLADLIIHTAGEKTGNSEHFQNGAKNLLVGVMLFVAETAPPGMRTLPAVRDLLTSTPEEFQELLQTMQSHGGAVAKAANSMLNKGKDEGPGMISTAAEATAWLDSPGVAAMLSETTIDLDKLKTSELTLYLVIPPAKVAPYASLLRLLTGYLMHHVTNTLTPVPVPALFLLDEVSQLGNCEPISRALTLIAGYGVILWTFWQDLASMKEAYPKKWESFLGNALLTQIFGAVDLGTLEYISRRASKTTELASNMGQNTGTSGQFVHLNSNDGKSLGQSEVQRDLMTVSEIAEMADDEQLLIKRGLPIIKAKKLDYLAEDFLSGRYYPSPSHG